MALPIDHLVYAVSDLEAGIWDLERRLGIEAVLVDPDHDLPAAIELLLIAVRGLGNLLLREPELDGTHDATHRIDLPDVFRRLRLDTVG